MTPAQQISLWAEKLRDISALGLRFSDNIYDRENYQALQDMAMEMQALANGLPLAEIEPLRATLFSHATPFATGDAAIINDAGQILLIQRADNHKWAMPGGALAVGETPAAGVLREALEETGVQAEAVALVAVHDSRLCGSLTAHHLYHFLFLCRPVANGPANQPASHGHEVLAQGWFAEDQLPAELDPGHRFRIPEAFRVWRGDERAYYDPGEPVGQGDGHGL
jgi:ADP-ribose pyrophosphatase YjhB (NUDIX family)